MEAHTAVRFEEVRNELSEYLKTEEGKLYLPASDSDDGSSEVETPTYHIEYEYSCFTECHDSQMGQLFSVMGGVPMRRERVYVNITEITDEDCVPIELEAKEIYKLEEIIADAIGEN